MLRVSWDVSDHSEIAGSSRNTTREKPISSACFMYISSAGGGATNKALQLTRSSSACVPALLIYKCSSSVLAGSTLLLIAIACFSYVRY